MKPSAQETFMTFRITARNSAGSTTYTAIGDRDALIDAAYDDGALGVTVMAQG
jgi:hypothetical protein